MHFLSDICFFWSSCSLCLSHFYLHCSLIIVLPAPSVATHKSSSCHLYAYCLSFTLVLSAKLLRYFRKWPLLLLPTCHRDISCHATRNNDPQASPLEPLSHQPPISKPTSASSCFPSASLPPFFLAVP